MDKEQESKSDPVPSLPSVHLTDFVKSYFAATGRACESPSQMVSLFKNVSNSFLLLKEEKFYNITIKLKIIFLQQTAKTENTNAQEEGRQ